MRKVKKPKPKIKKRNIEDVPFYKFKYKKEDLPLDPAKDFILEQIRIIKQIKSKEFHKDYVLYSYSFKTQCKTVSEGLRLPPLYKYLEEKKAPCFDFSEPFMSQEFCWLNQSSQPSEENVDNITKKLIQLHRDERIRVLHNLARTRAAFRSNEFFRRYRAPSGTIGQRSKRPSLFRRKEKSKKYKFDEFAFRTPEETLREREKIKAHMKKMIEADLARIKREEAKKLKEEEEKIKQAEKKKKRAELRQKIKSLPNDEYMRRLKKKDKE